MNRYYVHSAIYRSTTQRSTIAPSLYCPYTKSIVEINRPHILQHPLQVRSNKNNRFVFTSAKKIIVPLRRIRKPFGKLKDAVIAKPTVDFGALQLPYEHGEATIEDYLKKASLSPWVPMPDSAARKMFDLSAATSSDFHVDLGSGDGRVNFHAIDYGISKSLGVDVDSNIVQVARERLQRRHPKPDLEFVVADLLKDMNHPVWEQIQQATIITMYFATEGLQAFRPLLEMKLAGRQCKILTCGYEMPEWISKTSEVVNAMPLYLYEWGTYYEEEEDVETDDEDTFGDGYFASEHVQNPLQQDKYKGMNVMDHTMNTYPLPGFNPNYKQEEEEWDYDWDAELESVGGAMRAETTFGHPPSIPNDETPTISGMDMNDVNMPGVETEMETKTDNIEKL